jgi:hypothetical protein
VASLVTTGVGVETDVVETWLLQTLGASSAVASLATGGIYVDLAPQQISYPFITLSLMSAPDTYGIGLKSRIMTTTVYLVQAVSEATLTNMSPIVAAIDAALDGTTGSVTGATNPNGYILGVQRIEPYKMVETHEGRVINHRGGQYRITAQGI